MIAIDVPRFEKLFRLKLPRRLTWDGAFWLLLAGLLVMFAYTSFHIHVFLAGDPVTQFSPEVVALLNGQGIKAFTIDPYRGPVFPTLVAGVAWLLRGDVFVAGQVVEAAAYALFIAATFSVVRIAWDARTAFWAAASVGACAQILIIGFSWLTDLPFAALALLSLWCMYGGGQRWAWAALAAGLSAGLAFDTRWNGAFLIGAAIGGVVLNPWRARPARRAWWLLWFGVGFLILAVPWLAINNANHGSPFFFRIVPGVLEPALISPRLGSEPSLKNLILVDPIFFIPRYLGRLAWGGLLEVSAIVPPLVAIFIPAGALVALRRLDRGQLMLWCFTGVYWAQAGLTKYQARYYFPMLPLMMALPWVFLLSDVVPDRRLRGGLSLKLCLLGLGLVLVGASQTQVAQTWSRIVDAAFEPQVEAAKLLANPPPGSINGQLVAIQYYSGAGYFIPHYSGLSVGSLKTAAEYLKPPVNFTHILAEEAVPESKVPADLFNPLLAGPQLEAMFFKAEKPRAVLYQVLPENHVWAVQSVTVSASMDAKHAAVAVLDNDVATGWLTPPSNGPESPALLTADMGASIQMDRIWLLPPQNAVYFPETYQIEVSVDGATWTQIGRVEHEPLNQHQNPRIFAFTPMLARFVRFTSLRLRAGPTGEYQAGINGIRVSLSGVDQPKTP